jgi:hypothetical protein
VGGYAPPHGRPRAPAPLRWHFWAAPQLHRRTRAPRVNLEAQHESDRVSLSDSAHTGADYGLWDAATVLKQRQHTTRTSMGSR